MPIGKCSIEIDKFNTKMFPRNYGEVICFVSKSWLNCSSAHSSQVPRRFFSFWSGTRRKAWGGAKGHAKNCGTVSPALISCHASSQSPVHNGKMAEPGKERRRQGTWLKWSDLLDLMSKHSQSCRWSLESRSEIWTCAIPVIFPPDIISNTILCGNRLLL